jgi:ABC-type dipeptide/oligopeptide/nickel transport system permease subunit
VNTKALESDSIPHHISQFTYFRRVMMKRWVVVIGLVIIAILILTAIFAPLLAPYDPYQQDMKSALKDPSASHLLGTDEFGRDLLSRIIYGSRISLLVGIVSVSIAGAFGIVIGLLAGYYEGWINIIIMRIVDSLLSLPPLILILAISSLMGGGLLFMLIAIAIGMIPTYARLICGQVISLKESDYIVAAKSIGSSGFRIMFRHLLPNSFPPMLVLATTNLGFAIMMEASLSFLGIGLLPPTAAWGTMVSNSQRFILTHPMLSILPGLCIMMVVLSFNMVGDGIRDAMDPRLRGTL